MDERKLDHARPDRYACPCCGYPTLSERGGYDICELCDWEDDGQNDPHADEVWGGPNGDYSLAQARDNFKKHMIMYDPAMPGARRNTPGASAAKRELMQLFDELSATPGEAAQGRLWQRIAEAEARLRSAKENV